MSDGKSTDARFARIYNDPKFKKTNAKGLKIKLDDRFSKKDLEIEKKAKVDKYGRKLRAGGQNKKDLEDFDKYFEKEDGAAEENEDSDSSSSDEDTATAKKVIDRARGEVPSDYVSSEDELTSSDSEASGDSDYDSEIEETATEETQVESGDASKTLAVVNLDWDHVRAADMMVTFSSFVPKGGKIEKICIYPSEFGKERMQREEVEGPPKELFQKKKKKNGKNGDDDDSDVDVKDLYEEGDADDQVDKKALRQYQLDRLRYYYAVVYCNNVESAKAIYENCDGTEYESTANIIDLRYVPDDMTFDDEPTDSCNSVPKNYKPHQFSTDALQHSNVKLTWDETPVDRVEIAKRAFTQKEIEDMDFKAYLASDSDESEEEGNEETKNKLKALVGQSLDIGKKEKDNGEDGMDMEITFTPGLDEQAQESGDENEKSEETTIEKIRRKEKERRKARKQKLKELKQKSEEEKRAKLKSKNNVEELSDKKKAELELLMMDENEADSGINSKAHFNMNEILRSEKEKHKKGKFQKKQRIVEDNFKPNLNDPRFKEMFEDHDFAIDPSQPEFKETQAMKEILKERRKRARDHKGEDSAKSSDDVNTIVKKLKSKKKSKK
ncbi:Pre-rRNA-processing protein ESF1 [Nakaseomyces bracarensis]|uniref:Pre-rRNA-processing protein ESF1 n=1 Tax=Nakaseomyces bracarensis TaxID=273131 RepID=A0ABR4NXF9_9SACH